MKYKSRLTSYAICRPLTWPLAFHLCRLMFPSILWITQKATKATLYVCRSVSLVWLGSSYIRSMGWRKEVRSTPSSSHLSIRGPVHLWHWCRPHPAIHLEDSRRKTCKAHLPCIPTFHTVRSELRLALRCCVPLCARAWFQYLMSPCAYFPGSRYEL